MSMAACQGVHPLGKSDASGSIDAQRGPTQDSQSAMDIHGVDTGNGAIDTDKDNDGFHIPLDCDDTDYNVHPNAQEQCNEKDDDCDDAIDEDAGLQFFQDADEDGYGDDSTMARFCDPPTDWIHNGGDCDDTNDAINPGVGSQVNGVDSNCDGKKDWEVTIYAATDDAGELCVNTTESILGETGGWVNGSTHQIWLETGTHAVGVKGWDLGKVITATIVHLETSEGVVVVTDTDWTYDPHPAEDENSRTGWCSPGFDDSGWDHALDIGPIGDATNPWGDAPSAFPEGSPAHWIWDHFPVDLNTQYLRREFTLP